jgi:predicted CoA-substrate-specific enzyme activase
MIYTLGIDIGSTTSKCVILQDGKDILGTSIHTGGAGTSSPSMAMEMALRETGITKDKLSAIVATGYGRTTFLEAQSQMSELSCHARGVHHVLPFVKTIIDIGGQDAKVINLSDEGKMANFVMNDKCAAGTGRFLDVMANIFQLTIDQLETEAFKAEKVVKISNTCTVFAESEVISQLASGESISNIIAGICESVAGRTAALVRRTNFKEDVCMSGGVAKNGAVRKAMEKELGVSIKYSPMAQYMGALGAAIYAYDKT